MGLGALLPEHGWGRQSSGPDARPPTDILIVDARLSRSIAHGDLATESRYGDEDGFPQMAQTGPGGHPMQQDAE